MKLPSVILSFFIIFLSSFPCCQDTDSCSESSIVVDYCKDDSADEESHGTETPCSPFYTCGRCPGFTVKTIAFNFLVFESEQEVLRVPYFEFQPKEVYFLSLKPPRNFEV